MEPAAEPEKLNIRIVEAKDLSVGVNVLTDNKLWCSCEVKVADGRANPSKCQTEVHRSLSPVWAENHVLEQWCVGEALEFKIFDKGVFGSKLVGSVSLPSDGFYHADFDGWLSLSTKGQLHVIVGTPSSSRRRSSPEKLESARTNRSDKLESDRSDQASPGSQPASSRTDAAHSPRKLKRGTWQQKHDVPQLSSDKEDELQAILAENRVVIDYDIREVKPLKDIEFCDVNPMTPRIDEPPEIAFRN